MKLISQLAHVELITADVDASSDFFTDLLGLEVTEREGSSVYLRTWGEYHHHCVVLTQGDGPALGHISWRAQGPTELEELVRRIEATGRGLGWIPSGVGHGPAYRFTGPNGQVQEVFWETVLYKAPEHLKSPFPARPQRYTAKGAAARYLDHVNFPALDPLQDAEWYGRTMGINLKEWTELRESPVTIFATLGTEGSFELALLRDTSGIDGRFHHLALWVDQWSDVIRAAELFRDNGVNIEWGPGRHGHGESMSVYVREPGGMRIEIVSGGIKNPLPDWKPQKWNPEDGAGDFYLSNPLPEAFLEVLPAVDGVSSIAIDNGNSWRNR